MAERVTNAARATAPMAPGIGRGLPEHLARHSDLLVSGGAVLVVAMGERKLAERIRALALKANVPVVENRMVARALLATATVGHPIPPALYAAIAEILAFVYRQRGTLPGARALLAGGRVA